MTKLPSPIEPNPRLRVGRPTATPTPDAPAPPRPPTPDCIEVSEISFSELYRRYARMVHGILAARVPSDDVDDLLQDTMMRAFLARSQLRDPAKFGGWVATIARNVARAHLRHRGTPMESLPPDVLDRRIASDRGELNELYRALRELPVTYRETITLRLVEEMGACEIAELTGMQPGSVRVNLHRGMRILRERLTRAGASKPSLARRQPARPRGPVPGMDPFASEPR